MDGFEWFWSWGTSATQLARGKLGKKHTLIMAAAIAQQPRHGALSLAPPHTTISQHAVRQVYVIKTREYYCVYYLLAILRHNASSTHHA